MMAENQKPRTTDSATPVPSEEYPLTVGSNGPILLEDQIGGASFGAPMPIVVFSAHTARGKKPTSMRGARLRDERY